MKDKTLSFQYLTVKIIEMVMAGNDSGISWENPIYRGSCSTRDSFLPTAIYPKRCQSIALNEKQRNGRRAAHRVLRIDPGADS